MTAGQQDTVNKIDKLQIEDVQDRLDTRQLPINRVGVKDVSHPIVVTKKDGSAAHTIATFSMSVGLPHDKKGTHMSRFMQMLNESETVVTTKSFHKMLQAMVKRLEAESGYIEIQFPFFIEKSAPVSGVKGLMDY
ncbi:MAG: GTP cyclohydrolase, FolE2/MptA family, partial [Pseudomonadota bacterium]